MPNFTPVDYDPFAGAAEAAPNLFSTDRPLSGTAGALNPVPYNPFAGTSASRLTPVDHDPFADNPAAAPRLIPVDFDPFGSAAAPNLIPVDHDPFADNPTAAPKLIPVDYDPFADAASQRDGQQPGWNPQPGTDTGVPNSPDLTRPNNPQSAVLNSSSPLDFNSQPATQSDPKGLLTPVGFRLPMPWPMPWPSPAPSPGAPGAPPAGFEEWNKHAQEAAKGFFNFLRGRAGSGGGKRSDENDYCYQRYERELDNCKQFQGFGADIWRGCKDRATIRWDLCNRNGGKPSLNEPPEYSWNDIPRGMRPDD